MSKMERSWTQPDMFGSNDLSVRESELWQPHLGKEIVRMPYVDGWTYELVPLGNGGSYVRIYDPRGGVDYFSSVAKAKEIIDERIAARQPGLPL